METTITATELSRRLSDVLNRVKYRGEHFVVERNGEVLARLAPAGEPPGITIDELVARVGDLNMPRDGYADSLEAVQARQGMVGGDPARGKPTLTWGEFLDAYFTWPRPDDRFAEDLEAVLADRPVESGAPEWPD